MLAVLAGSFLAGFTVQAADEPPPLIDVDFTDEAIMPGAGSTSQQDVLQIRLPDRVAGIPIWYEGGALEDRYARLVPDPAGGENVAMKYWLKNARIPGSGSGYDKGRVQLNLTAVRKNQVFERHRMYLHPDIAHYRSYPDANRWFGLGTMWMGDPTKPNAFMISLDLVKEADVGQPLYFMVGGEVRVSGTTGQGQWQFVWADVNRRFEVPTGVWMIVEIGYRQGNANTGRFYMSVQPESAAEATTVFDITNWTYSPASATPVPLTAWQPFKLYTHARLLDHLRARGGVAQVYWDDLQIWDAWVE
jgi:hypothetical protein